MKTAISIPDELFRRVEARVSELRISRSEFFSTAAAQYLRELERRSVTEAIDDALRRAGGVSRGERDEVLEYNRRKGAERFAEDEW